MRLPQAWRYGHDLARREKSCRPGFTVGRVHCIKGVSIGLKGAFRRFGRQGSETFRRVRFLCAASGIICCAIQNLTIPAEYPNGRLSLNGLIFAEEPVQGRFANPLRHQAWGFDELNDDIARRGRR